MLRKLVADFVPTYFVLNVNVSFRLQAMAGLEGPDAKDRSLLALTHFDGEDVTATEGTEVAPLLGRREMSRQVFPPCDDGEVLLLHEGTRAID